MSTDAPNGTVVLAYSGGLDTSALIPWLKEKYGYDVVACLVDLGRVKGIPEIMERAKASGAIGAVAIDAKDEFAEHHCLPALMANALYEDKYPLSTA
ncbi:MAG: argininosuccinate synthase domain-containing protein, partial [Actinomycetes bacterium]